MDDKQRNIFKRLNDIIIAYTSEKIPENRQEFFREVHKLKDFDRLNNSKWKNIFDIYHKYPNIIENFVKKWETKLVRNKKIESILNDSESDNR